MLLQLLINSFSLGSFYALVALGFSLIFGVTHTLNMAHGEMILLSGYLAYALTKFFQVPFLWTIPISMFALLLGTVLLHKLLVHVQEPFELNTLVVTYGLALVLQNGMLMLFSANYRLVQTGNASQILPIDGIVLTQGQLLLLVLSLLGTLSVYLILRKTFLGKALRATIQDREAAMLAGINVRSISIIAFALGGLLIGIAGPLYARTAYLHPSGGLEATLIAIIITIFAGVGRVRAILLGGWVLGVVESITTIALGSSWREFVSAFLLILLLVRRPEGLLPMRMRPSRRT